jgi:hypothetical protein
MTLLSDAGEYTVSMLHSKVRRALSLLVALVMLITGLYAANLFSGNIEITTTITEGAVSVPASSHNCTTYQETEVGTYYMEILLDYGTVEVYVRDENATVSYWQNGEECPMTPTYNGTSGHFGWLVIGDEHTQPQTRYLVFNNPDLTAKMVSYVVTRHYTFNNYIALTAGIAVAAGGAIFLGLTLLGDKLRDFNRALDNQE